MTRSAVCLIGFIIVCVLAKAQPFTPFPGCADLEVVSMQFHNNDHDTLSIRVRNNCDTCSQHQYTGLTIIHGNDTLAVDHMPTSNPSPPNNGTHTYTLIAQDSFGLTESFRVSMNWSLCDSIPYASDIVLSNHDRSNFSRNNTVSISGGKIVVSSQAAIIDLYIHNMQGQLIESKHGWARSEYDLPLPGKGMYIITLFLSDGSMVNKKYVSLH